MVVIIPHPCGPLYIWFLSVYTHYKGYVRKAVTKGLVRWIELCQMDIEKKRKTPTERDRQAEIGRQSEKVR